MRSLGVSEEAEEMTDFLERHAWAVVTAIMGVAVLANLLIFRVVAL